MGELVVERRAIHEGPQVLGEVLTPLLHVQVDLRVVHRGAHLLLAADDARVLQRATDPGVGPARDLRRVEGVELDPHGLALAQDGDPREPRLESVELHLFPERA